MIFTSIQFLLFFVAAAGLYFVVPKQYRWIWLTLASVYFYAAAGARHLIYILVTALTAYTAARAMDAVNKSARRRIEETNADRDARRQIRAAADQKCRAALALCLCIELGILAVIKYLDFALRVFARLSAALGGAYEPETFGFLLPLGISFYTFQAIGYLVDVYRGSAEAQKNPVKLLLFLSFFPCVLQGPIGRYGELAPQLYEGHDFDYDRVTRGLQRMLWGFFEKLVIADRLAILVNSVFAAPENCNGTQLWLTMVLYAVQIYADFEGYMDVACGAAEVMGIRIAENFYSPYLSASVPEFWRRWHITLGGWFRDYLYYPVMRSRLFSRWRNKSRKKPYGKAVDRAMTVAALFVVWSLTGLWHGAGTTYIAWGLYHGVLIALSTLCAPLFDAAVERLRLDRERFSYRILQIAKTFFLVCVGYVFFRASSLAQARLILSRLFSRSAITGLAALNVTGFGLDAKDLAVAFFAVCLLVAVDLCRVFGVSLREKLAGQGLWLRWCVWLAGLTAVVILGVYGPGYDASSFIYFQF